MIPGFGLDVTQGAADAAVPVTDKLDVDTARQLSGERLGLIELRSEIPGLTQIFAIS